MSNLEVCWHGASWREIPAPPPPPQPVYHASHVTRTARNRQRVVFDTVPTDRWVSPAYIAAQTGMRVDSARRWLLRLAGQGLVDMQGIGSASSGGQEQKLYRRKLDAVWPTGTRRVQPPRTPRLKARSGGAAARLWAVMTGDPRTLISLAAHADVSTRHAQSLLKQWVREGLVRVTTGQKSALPGSAPKLFQRMEAA